MRTASCLLLVVILAVPAGAWQQMQGDAQRSGVLDWPGGPLDVVDVVRIHDVTYGTARLSGQSYLQTPYGITTVLRNGTDCILGHFSDLATAEAEWSPLTGCPGASLQAYDAVTDMLVLCTTGEDASVQLRAASDGSLRFRVPLNDRPGGGLPDPGDTPVGQTGLDTKVMWTCNGAALEAEAVAPEARRLLVVAAFGSRSMADAVDHRIVGIDMDAGQALWGVRFDTADMLGEAAESVSVTGPDAAPFLPMTVTLTNSGVVVSGRHVEETDDAPMIGWIALDDARYSATVAGVHLAEGQDQERSWAAAASGSVAVARVGPDLMLVEPSQREPLRVMVLPTFETAGPSFDLATATPVWHQGFVYLPTRNGIVALDDQDLSEQWVWSGIDRDWLIWNVAATGDGELLALAYHDADDGDAWHDQILLLRMDAFTGGVLQAVPVTLTSNYYTDPLFGGCQGNIGGQIELPCFDWQLPLEMVVQGDRLFLVTAGGEATVLAPAASVVTQATRYPREGERVDLPVPVDEDAVGVSVAWGDDAVETRRPESSTGLFRQEQRNDQLSFSHAFRDEGLARGSITTLHADNTTRTTAMYFDVGGTPPRDLNFIQRQFEPENQDRTWGVIGVGLAVLGGAYGYWFRTRRHRRIRQELEALNRIHARSLDDPEGALQDLDAHRRYLNGQLMSGKMDDGQYQLVMERAAGISRRLHRRLLGDLADRLSPGFYGLMEATLSDAFMNRDEAAHLRERLGQETSLKKTERDQVAALIDSWAQGATVGQKAFS